MQRRQLGVALALLSLLLSAGPTNAARPANAYPHLLIAPGFSTNVVSVFDLRTGRHVKDITNGAAGPCCAHATPDGKTVMVVDGFSPYVTTLDVRTLSVRRQTSIPGPIGDIGSDVQDDGKVFWASNLPQGDIMAIDIATGKVLKTYLKAGPHFQVRPDGRILFTLNGGMVKAWDTRTDKVIGSVAVSGSFGLQVLPGSKQLYVQDSDIEVLDIRDPAHMRVTKTIPVGSAGWVGVLSPDGKQFWIPGQDDKKISVVDVVHSRLLKVITVEAYGGGVVVSKDGRAYVCVSKRPFPTQRNTALLTSYLGVVPGSALGVPTTSNRPIDPPGEIYVYDTKTFQRVATPPLRLPGISFVLDIVENPPHS